MSLVEEVLASREPFSVGWPSPLMDATEKVLRWAIRYCSDMGSGPSPFEWDAIRTVARLATELQAAREVVEQARERHENWCGCGSGDDPSFVDPLCEALARYDEGRQE